jgi:hypothetical protein
MIARSPEQFIALLGDETRHPRRFAPVLRAALLVAPHGFRVSAQSATDNRYMVPDTRVDLERAHAQHQGLARKLVDLGVPTLVFPGIEGQDDGIFPNNVFATVPRRFIIGAMHHEVRRREAGRADIRRLFTEVFGYELRDLSGLEGVAELTGPLVIDRARGIGYCGLSTRADEVGCRAMHEAFALETTFAFDLVPGEYHTNLVLAILAGRVCVIHPPSFADPDVPGAIARAYPGATIVLGDDEKAAFACNGIAVTDRDVLVSATSQARLSNASREALESHGFRIHGVPIDELEKGGGSLRCLIAEVF